MVKYKFLVTFFILFMCSFVLHGKAYALSIELDGENIKMATPIDLIKGTTYVPITELTMNLGVENEWDNVKWEAALKRNDEIIKINIHNQTISKGNSTKKYNIYIKSGRTMVPIRAVSEALGYTITYDGKHDKVIVDSQVSIPILMYHSIANNAPTSVVTTPTRFKEQMYALKYAGFNPISPQQLVNYFQDDEELPPNPILLTFDDGYADNYFNAYPVLKELGFKATFFIIGHSIFDYENKSLNGSIPKLSWQQIEEMSELVTIQSHSYNLHFQIVDKNKKNVGALSTPKLINGKWETQAQYEQRIYNDTILTEELLYERLGYNSIIYSYPYGSFNETVINMLKSLNIPLAVTVKTGVVNKKTDPHKLNRITVNGSLTGDALIEKIINSRVNAN